MRVVLLPCSYGEAVDKLTILRIKSERMRDPAQLENVRRELALVSEALFAAIAHNPAFETLFARLKSVNEELWNIEDDIRGEEAKADFGADFVRLARAVYQLNDERAALKRQLNALLGSALSEEKSYGDRAPD